MGTEMKLSPPWVIYYKEIVALFGSDPDITIQYEEDENIINLRVDGQEKADAIAQILPEEKAFGNVVVKVNVIPANKPETKLDVFKKAFEGNPIFSYAVSIDTGITSNTFNYFVFKHKICQYYGDSLNDPHGNISMLYEDVARNVFEDVDGIMFSTDTKDNDGYVKLVK